MQRRDFYRYLLRYQNRRGILLVGDEMPRHRQGDYTLFPRKYADGTRVWNYYHYDETGKRQNPRSTGISYTNEKDRARTRREAEGYVDELREHGRIGTKLNVPTLSQFIARESMWSWRESTYVRQQLLASDPDRPGITESYVRAAEQITRLHVIPYHGDMLIDEIRPVDCETIMQQWLADGASRKSVNNWRSVYRVILDYWISQERKKSTAFTHRNPWEVAQKVVAAKRKYGGLTLAEGARFLQTDDLDLSAQRSRVYFYASKTALLTGLRIGEVVGLRTDDIHDETVKASDGSTARSSYIHVSAQWSEKLGKIAPTKDKDVRDIPILAQLRDELEQFMTGSDRFMFSFYPDQSHPIAASKLRPWFVDRLKTAVEIEPDAIKSRRLSFHSTRRFFNTLLTRAGAPSVFVQRFTGHDSDEMTEHYTDYLPADMGFIEAAQSALLTGTIADASGDDQ